MADEEITVVFAADDAFAMPLCVAVFSMLKNLKKGKAVHLYIIDNGITLQNRKRLVRSWRFANVSTDWLTPDQRILSHLKYSGHASSSNYSRLLAPKLLPEKIKKCIYLDSDILVLSDISEMWEIPLDNRALLAAQDITVPYMCSSATLVEYEACNEFISEDEPLPTYKDLNIPPTSKYFNTGILVMNIEKWRDQQIGERTLDYLHKYEDKIRWWDQDACNALLYDDWGEIDPTWNQLSHIYRYPTWKQSPFNEDDFNRILKHPKIIHFAAKSKPWHEDCNHPAVDLYFEYLNETDWKGWRPSTGKESNVGPLCAFAGRLKRVLMKGLCLFQ
jgi:lipopolysaccharide biosynthesis glycosyltransferase